MNVDSPWQAWAHRQHEQARCHILAALIQEEVETSHGLPDDGDPLTRRLINKLTYCCRSPELYRDEATGELIVNPDACNSRICPRCADRRGRELRSAMLTAVHRLDAPAFVTLTLRSSDTPLSEQLDRLVAAARRLRQRRSWRQHVGGGVQVVEITWNSKTNRWHPHLHILADLLYWPQKELAAEWQAVTGDSRVVHLERIHSQRQAASYVAKYCSKGIDLAKLPARSIPEAAAALHGRRMAQPFGSMHGTRTTAPDPETRRSLRLIGYVCELTQAAQQGDEFAQVIIRDLCSPPDAWDTESEPDFCDEVEAWFQDRPCRASNEQRTSRDSGDTAPSTLLLPGLPQPDPPPPSTTGGPL